MGDNTPASPSLPGGLSAIPGFAELAQSFPGGPAELQRVLNQPQVLDFISNNPDVIKKFLGDGLPSPDKLQALLALAAPPQEGVEQGIFGPDPFADEEFDAQGFGDYEYDDYEDYEDYGNFVEDNDIDETSERKGRSSSDLEKGKNETISHPSTTKKSKPKTSKKKPSLKYVYRLLGSEELKPRT